MTHLDIFLAGLSVDERNQYLDQRLADERAEAREEARDADPDAWQGAQDRYERMIFGE